VAQPRREAVNRAAALAGDEGLGDGQRG
jgi:hypothetical protein